ncbi:hypothetical protein ACFPOU_11320 [Massilia jejuensis]|uniref:4-amino-4-deoxy-L-arabinose transferase-like glycosyltransferase n=1 Tax=Massilia jejuensis TaxID=648894 RepID=A0ABW0PJN9_9BURK
MQTNSAVQKSLIDRVLALLVILNIALLLCYIWVAYKSEFHSDDAVANLLAQEIFETGQLFPRHWNYVNGDLWVFFTHSWIVPLLGIFPNGFELRAATSVIGAGLILYGTWLVCAMIDMSYRARLLTLALVAGGISTNMASNLFGQLAYGTMYYMLCFMLYSAWRFFGSKGRARVGWALGSAAVVLLEAWANPQRAAVYYLLPLLAASAALYALRWHADRSIKRPHGGAICALVAVALAAMGVGVVLYGQAMGQLHSVQPAGISPRWLGYDGMVRNAGVAIRGLLSLLGGLPQADALVVTSAGVVAALRFLSAIVLLALLPWAVLRNLRANHPARLFVAVASLASIALTLFVFVTTSIIDISIPEAPIRYVVPGLMGLLLILVYVLVDDRGAGVPQRICGALAIAVLVLTSPVSLSLTEIPNRLAQGELDATNNKMRLVRFLASQKLHYGYGNFWVANQTTVLSEGTTKIRPVRYVDGLPEPMRHLSSNRWYEAAAWNGPSILLLGADETEQVNWPELAKRTGQVPRILMFEGWKIAVFDHNIARSFPSWKMQQPSGPVEYPSVANTPHIIGRLTKDPMGLKASKNEAGILRFGPYVRLSAGRYRASFTLAAHGSGVRQFGHVDVVADNRVFASAGIERSGDNVVTVPFVLEKSTSAVEFRVISTGAGELTVYNVQLANDNEN